MARMSTAEKSALGALTAVVVVGLLIILSPGTVAPLFAAVSKQVDTLLVSKPQPKVVAQPQ
jgi:hypothetical protein